MKCPYCNYEHGWSNGEMAVIRGNEGEFFRLSNEVVMAREARGSYYRNEETKKLYGCPSCSKIFMEN